MRAMRPEALLIDPVARDAAIYRLVAQIPAGKVMTYGDVADYLGLSTPRIVGATLARAEVEVPWYRVVPATGRPAAHLAHEQLALLVAEGVRCRDGRVELALARATAEDLP